MPALGADMDEGTVLEWLVKPGDEVRKGDVIAVIDTAKAAIDVESFTAGTVERLLVDVGRPSPSAPSWPRSPNPPRRRPPRGRRYRRNREAGTRAGARARRAAPSRARLPADPEACP